MNGTYPWAEQTTVLTAALRPGRLAAAHYSLSKLDDGSWGFEVRSPFPFPCVRSGFPTRRAALYAAADELARRGWVLA